MVNSEQNHGRMTSGAPASAHGVAASSVDLDVAHLAECHRLRLSEDENLPRSFLQVVEDPFKESMMGNNGETS